MYFQCDYEMLKIKFLTQKKNYLYLGSNIMAYTFLIVSVLIAIVVLLCVLWLTKSSQFDDIEDLFPEAVRFKKRNIPFAVEASEDRRSLVAKAKKYAGNAVVTAERYIPQPYDRRSNNRLDIVVEETNDKRIERSFFPRSR